MYTNREVPSMNNIHLWEENKLGFVAFQHYINVNLGKMVYYNNLNNL